MAHDGRGSIAAGRIRPGVSEPPTERALVDRWRERADELEPYTPPAAEAWRRAAGELEAALLATACEALTLEASAQESGYTVDHLRHQVAAGVIPNAGRRGAPRICRGDLPRKPGGPVEPENGYDIAAHARRVVSR